MISSKTVQINLIALAILASSGIAQAEVIVPTIPTNNPGIPGTIPTIPGGTPTVPTTSPTVPTDIPTIPTGNTTTAIYTFNGFKRPIVNNGVTNTTKSKNIKFAWTLTDKAGATVTNPAVVVDRFYKEIDCNTDVASAGINPAGIRLSNTIWSKGRKNLEFSWKVPNLRKSCLLFSVAFDDGQKATAKFYVK